MTTKLDPEFLINAYASGYFPMPDPDTNEIYWYDPDPRCVIKFEDFHVSRSLKRRLNRKDYQVSINTNFKEVMRCCAARQETWINEEFIDTYSKLHEMGFAHSLEIVKDRKLIGGVYGIAVGGVFCAESKFHLETDASKVALFHLVEHLQLQGFSLLEVQFQNDHIAKLGATLVPKDFYHKILSENLRSSCHFDCRGT